MNLKKLAKKVKKATVGNKNFRKVALVAGSAAAIYFTGGAAATVIKKQYEKAEKAKQNKKLAKMYSGTNQQNEAAYDRTDTGDADMVDKLYRTGAGGAAMGAPVACGASGGDPMMFLGTVLFGAVLGLFLYWRQRRERV